MRPTTAIGRIATIATAAGQPHGLVKAHYPAPAKLPPVPWLILFWQGFEKTEGPDQLWLVTVRGQLATSATANLEDQIVRLDDLVVPIVDAFSSTNYDNYVLAGGGQQADFCEVRTGELSKQIMYAEVKHYGGELFWTVKLHRQAGDA